MEYFLQKTKSPFYTPFPRGDSRASHPPAHFDAHLCPTITPHHFGGSELLLVSRGGSPFKGDEDDLFPWSKKQPPKLAKNWEKLILRQGLDHYSIWRFIMQPLNVDLYK